ncbi:phytoene desaturase family protein [Geitlerinema calcuttense]|uniref:4,4'-diaponeurosporene oxygenase n=1 Tax=Geitlerinema calcuttense NRMC-F 0142 TaxID=2922238 RepID=A0ABT7M1M1_9CYAN|nr:phytoene desaturase family protein [Geitlerinema calcuttense]MDL5056956.1 phytoene desaturase family protein [Geitlerinema calcuttense NRMC-F 0142]
MQGEKCVIVGGGLAGLAAAIRLAHAGMRVVLMEKNATVGGKAGTFSKDGFTWDTGPSLVTMPEILRDLFESVGRKMEDGLTLKKITPVCRYFWDDGTVIDEDKEFFRRPEVRRFMNYAEKIYELSGEAFLKHPPERFHQAFLNPRNLRLLHHLPKVMTLKSVDQMVRKYFSDPHLRQLFNRFATYNGSDPYRAPATFNIIPYVEEKFGAWYPEGGIVEIPRALEKLARELGVEIRLDCPVTGINFQGVKYVADGKTLFEEADIILCNADLIHAHDKLLYSQESRRESEKMANKELSCSGYILFLGVNRRYDQLSHHNIFFSKDYAREFRHIFKRFKLPEDMTIYISVTSRTDARFAPPGCDNYFVLINSPTTHMTRDENYFQNLYPKMVIRRLEEMGLDGLEKHIVSQTVFTAYDFAERDNATGGALYGHASNTPLTALLRPPIRSKAQDNLYFVGGTTHPGGGIPLVLLSAKMAVEMILQRSR